MLTGDFFQIIIILFGREEGTKITKVFKKLILAFSFHIYPAYSTSLYFSSIPQIFLYLLIRV